MKKSRRSGAVCACLISSVSISALAAGVSGQGTWETTLQARDLDSNPATVEAYYDTVLGITWLANANFAGITMPWVEGNTWAAALNPYNSGITGWRLPTMLDTGPLGCPNGGWDNYTGGTDCGYNVQTTSGSPPYPATTVYSEMASMFYDTLGNLAEIDTAGNIQPPGWGLTNTGPFSNIVASGYFTGVENANNTSLAWVFVYLTGRQITGDKHDSSYAWAVHDGDVGASVVVPSSLVGVLPATPGGTDYQAYYDPNLDITWAADAYSNGASDNWDNHVAWVSTLTIAGIGGWRLPSADVNGDDAVVDCTGGGITGCADNEMGYLFWDENITAATPGPFSNVIPGDYFSGTELASNPAWAWNFRFDNGSQGTIGKSSSAAAWVVHSGDVRLLIDSDSDGLPDYVEDSNHNGIVDPGETNPFDPDTDNDGALDGQEDSNHNGVVDAGEADPLDFDSDDDGLTDGYEINVGGTDPSTSTTVYTLQCDMNYDDEVNVGDLLLLQRQLLGL